MSTNNPLADNSPDHEDQNLVLRARSGDRKALEELVQRHQAWIYNIAVRMLYPRFMLSTWLTTMRYSHVRKLLRPSNDESRVSTLMRISCVASSASCGWCSMRTAML